MTEVLEISVTESICGLIFQWSQRKILACVIFSPSCLSVGSLGWENLDHEEGDIWKQPQESKSRDRGTCSVSGWAGHHFGGVEGQQPEHLCHLCEQEKMILWTSGSAELHFNICKEISTWINLQCTWISLWTFLTAVQSFLPLQRTINLGNNNSCLQRLYPYGYQGSL